MGVEPHLYRPRSSKWFTSYATACFLAWDERWMQQIRLYERDACLPVALSFLTNIKMHMTQAPYSPPQLQLENVHVNERDADDYTIRSAHRRDGSLRNQLVAAAALSHAIATSAAAPYHTWLHMLRG